MATIGAGGRYRHRLWELLWPLRDARVTRAQVRLERLGRRGECPAASPAPKAVTDALLRPASEREVREARPFRRALRREALRIQAFLSHNSGWRRLPQRLLDHPGQIFQPWDFLGVSVRPPNTPASSARRRSATSGWVDRKCQAQTIPV
jgi:hypothetical protein